MDTFNIVVFGCWNTGCTENSGQRSVSEILKKNEKKYEFVVILGDNYYAKKLTLINDFKVKITKLSDAKSGFDCLDNIKLEKKLIMGNHDVVDSFNNGCSVLKSQLKLPWYDIKFPFSFDFYYLSNDSTYETILMIYLDTTIYNTQIMNEQLCYSNTIGKSKTDLLNEQNEFIIKTLEMTISNPHYQIKNVIFFGHEPLFTFKKKGELLKPLIIKELLKLLFDEKKKYKNLNFYWICADYHIYQNTEIIDLESGNKIPQWIFGTGGGKLDSLVDINTFNFKNTYQINIIPNIVYDSNYIDVSTNFTSYGVDRFGYGEITFELCSVKHKFIMSDFNYTINNKKNKTSESIKAIKAIKASDAIEVNETNVIKNKYLKYKKKYIELNKKNKLI